jgi:methyltransferase-like protein
LLGRCGDSYLFHEHLEDVNEPTYFHEFAERAAANGLRYLGEAELSSMLLRDYPPEVEAALRRLAPDMVHLEQLQDFLQNRTFRQTLLCHQGVTPDYRLSAERLRGLYAASAARPQSARPDLTSTAKERFTAPGGAAVKTTDPLAKAALIHLAEVWPRAVPFEELRVAARARLGLGGGPDRPSAEEDARVLGQCLLTCYLSDADGLVHLWTQPPPFAAEAGERPRASPLARLQAAASAAATNLRHETLVLDDFSRAVLGLLDGRRDRPALLRELTEAAAPAHPTADLGQDLDETLTRLTASAFLAREPESERRGKKCGGAVRFSLARA